jgi:Fe-S-cluster-containing dehydrogenase component
MSDKNEKTYGILIDYEYCTGCHSCEVACKKELDLLAGQFGVQLTEVGPWKIDDDHWEWVHMPVFTKICNLCQARVAEGKAPACVHHCQAYCMYYDTVEELAKKMIGKSRMILCVPQNS